MPAQRDHCYLRLLSTLLVAALLFTTSVAQERQPRGGGERGPRQVMPAYTRESDIEVIAGRPTDHSCVLNILRYATSGEARLTWQEGQGHGALVTRPLTLTADQPQEVVIDQLASDTAYRWQLSGGDGGIVTTGRIHTQRPSGSHFRVTVTADSHLDQNTDPVLYRRALANVRADNADFHIDLGDTFMTEKHVDRASAAKQYLAQHGYLAAIGTPLFLVLGNHDGEEARQRRGAGENLASWSNTMRQRYFPNPVPDRFFSGNGDVSTGNGALADYYAWTWGDALFIVLDPYWYAGERRGDEGWNLSLGKTQYDWLARTLANSRARYKLVFVHQLVGGQGDQGRGGIEMAGFGEWGGRNGDGSDGFAAHRPGWNEPIHALLKRYGVNLVLHGHDHLFAAQTLDGIAYQEVPQPGHPGNGQARDAETYGYRNGSILGQSGYLRLNIGPDGIVVEFLALDSRQLTAPPTVAYRYAAGSTP